MGVETMTETDFTDLSLVGRGKVRDIYKIEGKLVIVSTDRLSAFDVVLPDPIPHKGKVLNQLSVFWMKKTNHIAQNHLITDNINQYPVELAKYSKQLKGRSMLVKKASVFPVECIARGYIIGSGWAEYNSTGSISGIRLPKGLKQAEKLPEPVFTPSTKAEIGEHDQNISFDKVVNILGSETSKWLREKTLEIYRFGASWAEKRGIIIADTKFEFGVIDGDLAIVDEILTPDSSRFWPMDQYRVGMSPPSLDKQYVRDYLENLNWDKKPPAPGLPAEVVNNTSNKYLNIYKILTGSDL
ncbi:MAG: phosphoribosylaminoimidazolesuccinocarboxamide synthase [Desulfomonilaceae bacterium]|jgi:phosphoribosylaminoimidazole-succinocarboxamide synthase|nr:phosphoribosylaminoimidazolesuccinocarboxamide synthase [Syntrophaceae bacterium]